MDPHLEGMGRLAHQFEKGCEDLIYPAWLWCLCHIDMVMVFDRYYRLFWSLDNYVSVMSVQEASVLTLWSTVGFRRFCFVSVACDLLQFWQ